jgi:hypothetical protein
LVGNNKYITYTENGIIGSGSKTWTFDWIAPEAGTGEVVFYGAYNSNFEGHKGENHVFLSRLTVNENLTAIKNPVLNDAALRVFPNPAKAWVEISFERSVESVLAIDVIDIKGQVVAQLLNEKRSGKFVQKFDTSTLPNGLYFVRLVENDKISSQKLIVMHE